MIVARINSQNIETDKYCAYKSWIALDILLRADGQKP
jgi:hypothetical protein